MSFLVYYLILHLCVSMHACSSRHLGVFHKEPGKELRFITSKTPELMVEFEGRNYEDSVEIKKSKLEFLSNEWKTSKGNDIKVQISQEENKVETVEVWKNHRRSTMGSKLQDSKEAINKSEDNSVAEDVVVMDYAQPHRKPPIHNIQP